jgi:hypothetical protein
MNMTHPDILQAEQEGMPPHEPEKVKCACGEWFVREEIEYCEWQGCENRRCVQCLTQYFDPVLGDRNRTFILSVCEQCAEAIEDIANARTIRDVYKDTT